MIVVSYILGQRGSPQADAAGALAALVIVCLLGLSAVAGVLTVILPCDACGRRQVFLTMAETKRAAEHGLSVNTPVRALRERRFRCVHCFECLEF